jgi:EAL domain-containing protein (putative c-di-GMP-specific phosphodiesterase class I)
VRLALDDFGTGYSSLSSLRQLPFDIMKIDQSFIAAMVDSPKGVAMVRTMIQMGRQQKLEVIAEGVEHQQQLDLLRRLHCQYAQGYLFSRPFDAETISTFLTEWAGDRTSELHGTSSAVPVGGLPQPSTVGPPS